jgi:hypothetical protein
MKRELEEGIAREAEAQAAILAANARRAQQPTLHSVLQHRIARHPSSDARRVSFFRGASPDSSKEKDYFVAMVSHEARTRLLTFA